MSDTKGILPPHTDEERQKLRADIEAHGLESPVVLDENGNIIDGRLRVEICQALKIDWKKGADVRFKLTEIEKQALRIRLNILRRQTPPTRKQRQEYRRILLLAHPEMSDGAIASMCGCSQPTISRLRQRLIQKNELKQKPASVIDKRGVKRVVTRQTPKPRSIVKSSHDYEETTKAGKLLGEDAPGGLVQANHIRRLARMEKARRRALESNPRTPPQNIVLHHCDLRNLSVQPESVDLILTDVMWDREAEDDWRALAEKAAIWLKPNGLFASIIGQRYVIKLATTLGERLHFRWLKTILFHGHKAREKNGILTGFRPVVVMARRQFYKFKGIDDVVQAGPPEKEYSPLQQSLPATRTLLERLSNPGDLIVDPCMGTGTTAVAVLTAKDGPRKFIGCDRDEEMYKIAMHRVSETTGGKEAAA